MAGPTRTLIPLCGLLALLLAGTAAAGEDEFAGPAFLVRNINERVDLRESSSPRNFTAAGDVVFFTADDWDGSSLWRTDGTPGGTISLRVVDVGRGPVSFGDLVAVQSHGSLWRSDGTVDGTFALADLYAESMVGIGGRLYFVTVDWDNNSHVLWSSDGSRDGTKPLRRFARPDWCSYILELRTAGDRLYAISSAERDPCTRIWAADVNSLVDTDEEVQTATPTEFPLLVSRHDERANAGDILLFVASDAENATALWRSDGTAEGTFPLLQGSGIRGPFFDDFDAAVPHFAENGQRVYFIATDGVHGFEPWVTDGHVDGTRMFADVLPGAAGLYPCAFARDLECNPDIGNIRLNLIPRETDLLIARNYYGSGIGSDLWESDGTVTGTGPIEDVVPGSIFGYPYFAGRDRSLLFQVHHGDGPATWYGDGTLGGSRPVGALGATNILEAASGFIFVGRHDGVGDEPWWSDGTPEGTYLLRDIQRSDASSSPRDLTDLGGLLLFSANTAAQGRELWRSDATADGTTLVVDIQPGSGGANPAEITRLGDVALFTADDGVHGAELWSSDGTAAGTAMVRDIQAGATGAHPNRLALVDGVLYFYADDGVHGVELWSSDGTADGTHLVADVNPNGDGGERIGGLAYANWGAEDRYIAGLDGSVYFVADDGTHGVELWRSDGPGTVNLVLDIRSGAASSRPHSLVAASGALYFVADDGTHGAELWRTDGSESGTGSALAFPFAADTAAHRIDDTAVFIARSPSSGLQLTSVDSSGRATSRDLPELSESDRFQTPVGSAGSIFLVGYEGLWRSDVGVLEPYDYYVGRLSTVSDVGGKLVVAVRDYWGQGLEEIWTSDGTPHGTVRLQSLRRFNQSFDDYDDPAQNEFVAAGDHIFFSADVGGTGRELWALPLSALPDVQPLATPTATVPIGGDATPTPTATATAEDTPTASPTATAPCTLDGDPPGCARVEVDDITATAGDTASIAAHLRSLGEPIAALQVDLTFDPRVRVIAEANGSPRCRVDPDLGKDATAFAFRTSSCSAGGEECATVRALVLSIANLDPIADGATLFSCDVRIDEDAPAATYPITASEAGASSSKGMEIEIGARDGSLAVVRRAASNLDPATSSSGSCAIDPQPTSGIAPIAAALLATVIARRGRRARPRRTLHGAASLLLPIAQVAFCVGLTARASLAEPFAYVANLGADSIDVIDLATHEVVATLPAGDDPNGTAASADGRRVYVTNFFSNDVTVVDTATQSVVDTIAVGEGPVGIAVSPDGQRAYVANRAGASVSVIDIAAGLTTESVAVDRGPNSIAITPDGATAAVTSSFTRFPGIVNFISLPGLAVGTAEVQRSPTRVAIAPDGRTAWVTNFRSWNVSVLDITSRQTLTTVRLLGRPSGVAFNPNGTFAYVTTLDGFLQVIDVPFHRVHTKIPVGGSPYGIGIVRNGGVGYVPSFDDDTVTVVDLAHHEALETIAVGDRPFAVAVTCAGDGCVEPPLAALPTNTPTVTLTPSLTPTITPTPTVTLTPTTTETPVLSGDEPVIRANTVSVRPGDRALVQVSLDTRGASIASLDHRIRLQPPLIFVRTQSGVDCVRNTAIRKNGTVFRRVGFCGSSSCTEAEVTVVATDNVDPIADGSLLYSCRIDVPHDAPQGAYLVELHSPTAFAPDAAEVEIFTRSGEIVVSGSPRPTSTPLPPTPTLPPPATATATPTSTPGGPSATPTRHIDPARVVGAMVQARRGDRVTVDFHYQARGLEIVGIEARVLLGEYLSVPVNETSVACTVNPAINRRASAFSGCFNQPSCNDFLALILDFGDLSPIADGARLFSCEVTVAADAPLGVHAFDITNVGASSHKGDPLPIIGVAGSVRVVAGSALVRSGLMTAGAGLCAGGAQRGAGCDGDADCPGGACVIAPAVCDGGEDDGLLCGCPGGTCGAGASCGGTSDGRCAGGSAEGDCCQRDMNCAGGSACVATQRLCAAGAAKGVPCTDDRHCPGSQCIESDARCTGGDFDGYACIDGGDCPLGACARQVVAASPSATPAGGGTPTPTALVTQTSEPGATATPGVGATAARTSTATPDPSAPTESPTATRSAAATPTNAPPTALPSASASSTTTPSISEARADDDDGGCAVDGRPTTPAWFALLPPLVLLTRRRREAPAVMVPPFEKGGSGGI